MNIYNKQLKAGYILSYIKQFLDTLEKDEQSRIYNMFAHDADFELVSNFCLKSLPSSNKMRILSLIAQNIVQRGFPTLAPDMLESFVDGNDKSNALLHKKLHINLQTMQEALSIYDADYKFSADKRYYQKTPEGMLEIADLNRTERRFLTQKLSSRQAQFFELQKPLETVVCYPNTDAAKYTNYTSFCLVKTLDKLIDAVRAQRLDFALQLPAEGSSCKCMAVELDGPQHGELMQSIKDRQRDSLLKELNWHDTLRIKDIDDNSQYLKRLNDLFGEYPWESDENNFVVRDVRLALYTARMTMTFLYLIENGVILLGRGRMICVSADTVGRIDMNALILGLQNAMDIMYHLAALEGNTDSDLGTVCLKINRTNGSVKYVQIDASGRKELIDFSFTQGKAGTAFSDGNRTAVHIISRMNQRLFAFEPSAQPQKTVWLYSAYACDDVHKVRVYDRPVNYNITEKNSNHLKYFLQNIFQKKEFRFGQTDIVQEAMRRKNVIGVLPTGSGKTLTYQLAGFLQPGTTIIVEPLISLMNDQVHNLNKICIGSCSVINSSLTPAEKRLIMKNIGEQRYQFIYIAPERLQIKEFKELLAKVHVSYAVLDEAHCVSQWGHDFRTAYLRVGECVERYLKNAVTMALTGTASCNVITDIKRELNMTRNVKIVMPTNFKRDELHFKIIEMPQDMDFKAKIADRDENGRNQIDRAIQKAVDYYCTIEKKPADDINEREKYFFGGAERESTYENAGLVFCPFAKKSGASAEALYDSMKSEYEEEGIKVGLYHGQMNVKDKNKSQSDFIDNKTAVLISTKAFGMGIDKPNIRFTVHTCIPESIEAFYQEAGRAGRDRKTAVNIIISPPLTKKYEDTLDKEIYRFFLDNSFPSEESFKRQAIELLYLKGFSTRCFNDSLMEEFWDEYRNREVSLTCDGASRNLVLTLNAAKIHHRYTVSMDNERKIEIRSLNDTDDMSGSNMFYREYEKYVQDMLVEKLENSSVKQANFVQAFNAVKVIAEDSIITAIKKANENDSVYCLVGLSKDILTNPIDRIIGDLNEKKGCSLTLNKERYKEIESVKKDIAKDRKHVGRIVKDFYESYCLICIQNKISPDSKKEFEIYVDEILGAFWGGISTLQDKVLYYLGVLGIYSDYERVYWPNCAKIRINKVDKAILKRNIRNHIRKYETADYVEREMKKFTAFDDIAEDDVEKLVETALGYVIHYSYEKIKEYRMKQTQNMYACMQASAVDGDDGFVREVYMYFESKYAAALSADVNRENLNTPLSWIKKIKLDSVKPAENFLNNLSHLRSSAIKVKEGRPQAFTPYFLYAYSIFKDDSLDIRTGIDSYIEGVKKVRTLRQNYKTTLTQLCKEYFSTEDMNYLAEVEKILNREYLPSSDSSPDFSGQRRENQLLLKEMIAVLDSAIHGSPSIVKSILNKFFQIKA